MVCGILGYYAFYADNLDSKIDNVLELNAPTYFTEDIFGNIVRLLIACQYITLIPLLGTIARGLGFIMIFGTAEVDRKILTIYNII